MRLTLDNWIEIKIVSYFILYLILPVQYLAILLQDWIVTLRLVVNSHWYMIDQHRHWFDSWFNVLLLVLVLAHAH